MFLFKCKEIVEPLCVKSCMTKNKSMNSELLTFWHNLRWIYLNISEFLIVNLHVPLTTCHSGDCHLELSSLCDHNTYRDDCYSIKMYWQFSYFHIVYSFLKHKMQFTLQQVCYVVLLHFETKVLFYMPFILFTWVWFHFAVNVIIFKAI
jgi:hypothetical protein